MSISSTSQVNKEILAETLDQIHSSASQSDALTTFNEYASPPSSSSGPDDKGIASELQGGLSGLYSRFRASVGNVKEIVTLSAEDSVVDDISTKSPRLAVPSPISSRLLLDPVKSPNPSEHAGTEEKSLGGSRHSSRGATPGESFARDGHRRPRLSKLSSGNTTTTSRVNLSHTGPLRSPASLATAAASVVSPAVVEVNVSATKEPTLAMEAVARGNSTQDTVDLVKPSLGSRLEAKLSSTVGHQRPAEPLEDLALMVSQDPHGLIGDPINSDENLRRLREPDETKDPHNNPPNGLSANDISDFRSNDLGSPGAAEPNEIGRNQRTIVEKQELPKIIADPGTPQPPTTGGPLPLTIEKGLLSSTNANSQQGHIGAPFSTSTVSQPHNRPRTPEMNLMRTSSETTATSLVHVSRHKQHTSKELPKYLSTSNVVLSQARSKILSREYWMRDENARDCFYCGDPFSTFRRKHHCSM